MGGSFDKITKLNFLKFFTALDDAARQALDWGLMELQEFLEDEELALGVKGEGPGMNVRLRNSFGFLFHFFFSFFPYENETKTIFWVFLFFSFLASKTK